MVTFGSAGLAERHANVSPVRGAMRQPACEDRG